MMVIIMIMIIEKAKLIMRNCKGHVANQITELGKRVVEVHNEQELAEAREEMLRLALAEETGIVIR